MENFVHVMLHDSPAALKIMSLWKEYEDQSTAEARFVKGGLRGRAVGPHHCLFFGLLLMRVLDLDRFEMAAQALEYERAQEGANKCPLKGMMADAIFFYRVVHTSNDNNSPAAVLR